MRNCKAMARVKGVFLSQTPVFAPDLKGKIAQAWLTLTRPCLQGDSKDTVQHIQLKGPQLEETKTQLFLNHILYSSKNLRTISRKVKTASLKSSLSLPLLLCRSHPSLVLQRPGVMPCFRLALA